MKLEVTAALGLQGQPSAAVSATPLLLPLPHVERPGSAYNPAAAAAGGGGGAAAGSASAAVDALRLLPGGQYSTPAGALPWTAYGCSNDC